jgi:hypothetical protein
MPGALAARLAWTSGPTVVELTLRDANMTIAQDGKLLAQTEVAGALGEQLRGLRRLKPVTWRSGVYGPFAGKQLDGSVTASAKP